MSCVTRRNSHRTHHHLYVLGVARHLQGGILRGSERNIIASKHVSQQIVWTFAPDPKCRLLLSSRIQYNFCTNTSCCRRTDLSLSLSFSTAYYYTIVWGINFRSGSADSQSAISLCRVLYKTHLVFAQSKPSAGVRTPIFSFIFPTGPFCPPSNHPKGMAAAAAGTVRCASAPPTTGHHPSLHQIQQSAARGQRAELTCRQACCAERQQEQGAAQGKLQKLPLHSHPNCFLTPEINHAQLVAVLLLSAHGVMGLMAMPLLDVWWMASDGTTTHNCTVSLHSIAGMLRKNSCDAQWKKGTFLTHPVTPDKNLMALPLVPYHFQLSHKSHTSLELNPFSSLSLFHAPISSSFPEMKYRVH